MASSLKNLSDYDVSSMPNGATYRIGIVLAEWHNDITDTLFEGAHKTLIKHGVHSGNIVKKYVPGTFELTLGAQFMLEELDLDAVITLGCVIQGETRHFDFICQGVTLGITDLNIKYNTPVIFGVLTTDTLQQAQDRAGGKHGNKGDEAAVAALKMVHLKKSLRNK